ncbi:MAG TPA: hypothetical protein PKA21_16515 [Kiritimatiellia bacterium]|nr:hypothetical protein [Kiritimatiellia bacterium]HMP97682.1 hypothetical protein [Kiritimatiellia bacterium]
MAAKAAYDPAVHHRRSIRCKAHDYAGGGEYFITICAHRDAGNIFAPPAVQQMVGRVWQKVMADAVGAVGAGLVPAPLGTHEGCPYAVMPDHFHGIIRVAKGRGALGDFIGAFKSLVVHEYMRRVKAGEWPAFPGKIWHRNYYECIVRNAEAHEKIAHYIRMNPWKLIHEGIHEGHPYRAIGNPALMNLPKIGVLCSRGGAVGAGLVPALFLGAPMGRHKACPYIGGFHSDAEKIILAALLKTDARIICCPAWGIQEMHIPPGWLPALEQNRMLILEWRAPVHDGRANLADARARNAFIMQIADQLWIPHMTPGGMIESLVKELKMQEKVIAPRLSPSPRLW